MDVLSDILDTLKFKGSFYFTTHFSAPWGIEVPAFQNVARFHMAVGGECWVRVEGAADPVLLSAGDMIIIPHGARHVLSDHLNTRITKLDAALAESGYEGEGHFIFGGGNEVTGKLVCGHLDFSANLKHPILEELPPYLLVTGDQAIEFGWFESAMKFMAFEARRNHLGNSAMIRRLSEILFIHGVRVWHQTDSGKSPASRFLSAVADRHIGNSLRAFHQDIGGNWSLETLSDHSGLSRSLFVERFRTLTGYTPMSYVTMWRVQRACQLILETNLSTDAIADHVGYQSTAAFAKVFKKLTGVGPGAYRRDHKELANAA